MGIEATMNSVWQAVDRPTREALRMADRPLVATLAPAAMGVALVAASSILASQVPSSKGPLLFRPDVLRAVFEALGGVVPATLVFAIYLRMRLRPRVLLAATAIGLLMGGLVTTCTLPLIAFLSLVWREGFTPAFLGALLPGLALAAAALVPARIFTALDPSRKARWLARAHVALLMTICALRVAAQFPQSFWR